MTKRRLLKLAIALFIIVNLVAFQHAYRFTHFSNEIFERQDPATLSFFAKVQLIFTGIEIPKARNINHPRQEFQTVKIQSTKELDCWKIKTPDSRGTVVMFHGYAGEKSSLLKRSEEFIKLGYSIFLVDFMGSGSSEGSSTSIGYKEAEQVKDCFNYVLGSGEHNIILFGTSMGAAAILKAIDDYSLNASSIILECPFGSLYKTVKARFKIMRLPDFPMASFLCFWGGVQNGYWAFSHNPSEYAKSVTCPLLLLYGEVDNRVSNEETDLIFENLNGKKVLKKYPGVGHDVFMEENRVNWTNDVTKFLQSVPSS
jgi:uncharacterized protein